MSDLPWRVVEEPPRQLRLPDPPTPRPIFGRDRMNRAEAETAPAWPSLADVAANYRAELRRR